MSGRGRRVDREIYSLNTTVGDLTRGTEDLEKATRSVVDMYGDYRNALIDIKWQLADAETATADLKFAT